MNIEKSMILGCLVIFKLHTNYLCLYVVLTPNEVIARTVPIPQFGAIPLPIIKPIIVFV